MTQLEDQIRRCRHCPRLRSFLDKNKKIYPDYWNKPVVASGQNQGLLIVGLAPGLHGANKTGVPFTGDASGQLLFHCLNQLGVADQVAITNAVKCVPPENAPLTSERKNCRKFLRQELNEANQRAHQVFFCLGKVAHDETLRCLGIPLKEKPFTHGNVHDLGEGTFVVDSYHCSRYNINTNRLTESMFLSALQCAVELAQLDHADV